MQAHQRLLPQQTQPAAGSVKCGLLGHKVSRLHAVSLLVMEVPAFLLGCDHETVINAPCSLLDTGTGVVHLSLQPPCQVH